jgi:hypothetical protein
VLGTHGTMLHDILTRESTTEGRVVLLVCIAAAWLVFVWRVRSALIARRGEGRRAHKRA